MTRVVLPEAPGTEWAPPADGHLDGYGGGGWGGGFMAFFAVLLEDTDSPQGGGTAYWPRSHLANHRYFLRHPERIDGSYLFEEPVKSRGHVGLLDDPSVGEVTCVTGKAGDAMLFHGLTTHNNSTSRAGGTQPRVALFARYAHKEMREQAPMVMFPDADGNPWVPASDDDDSTPILPLGDPGRLLQRYEVPQNLWKHWGPAMNEKEEKRRGPAL